MKGLRIFRPGRVDDEVVANLLRLDVVPVAIVVFGRAQAMPCQLILVLLGKLLGEVGGFGIDGGGVMGMGVYRDGNDEFRHGFRPRLIVPQIAEGIFAGDGGLVFFRFVLVLLVLLVILVFMVFMVLIFIWLIYLGSLTGDRHSKCAEG